MLDINQEMNFSPTESTSQVIEGGWEGHSTTEAGVWG